MLGRRGASWSPRCSAARPPDLGDGPVVVVPPGRLAAVPWTLMPSLRDRVVTVAPSAATWMRARRKKPPPGGGWPWSPGPGWPPGVRRSADCTPATRRPCVLGHGGATAEPVFRALDGAWLAHIAAHGTFRADNPLFSSLRLDDGPLTVHDFERLGRAPHRLVLSSCDSGSPRPWAPTSCSGLVSSLIPLGAAGIVASVVPVNDVAAVPLMLALHAALQRRGAPGGAAGGARGRDDPMTRATAHSFLALGA